MVNRKNIRDQVQSLVCFTEQFHSEVSKCWNVRQKSSSRIQWRMTARAVWLQHSPSTGFGYDWRGHREAFVRHLLRSTPVLRGSKTAKDKMQQQISHFCTHLSCALLSGSINPAGIWKNTQGHMSAPSVHQSLHWGRDEWAKGYFTPRLTKSDLNLNKILVV